MKILFIGAVIPDELSDRYKGISIAGNKMQLGIIQSLAKMPCIDVETISLYPIASFPKEKVIGMFRKKFITPLNNSIIIVPFLNLFLIKQLSQMLGLLVELIKWVNLHRKNDMAIICYNAFTEWALPTLIISKISNIRKVCLLADLPIDDKKFKMIKKLARKLQIYSTLHFIKQFDGLIVLNKEAQKRYAPKSPYCIIDGGVRLQDFAPPLKFGGQELNNFPENTQIILFSGALTEYNGIVNLINAIKLLNFQDVIFSFFGEGPLKGFVIDASEHDKRIRYNGIVPNIQILELQKKSSFLINPRLPNDPITQVTFPSKILEYMMSGTPILTTKINGLTKEYENLLLFISSDPIEMARDIEFALKLDKKSLAERSKLAYEYVINKKNWDLHANTICSFIYNITKNQYTCDKSN